MVNCMDSQFKMSIIDFAPRFEASVPLRVSASLKPPSYQEDTSLSGLLNMYKMPRHQESNVFDISIYVPIPYMYVPECMQDAMS